MTTRGSPRLRQIYKVLAARVGTTMEEMQVVALRSFLTNYQVSRSEHRAVWEALRKRFPEYSENDADLVFLCGWRCVHAVIWAQWFSVAVGSARRANFLFDEPLELSLRCFLVFGR
jgi:hypothetical protein